MTELVPDAERLLAGAPEAFVAERKALAQTLRDEGRTDDAATVEKLRKPSKVVFAVNRGARDRPKAARAAADAAERVKELQLGGDADAFQQAIRELDDALDLLTDVAVAHVAEKGRAATESMRHRVRDLLRSAVADDDAREALARGALTEELEAPGFSPFAGMPQRAPSRPRKRRGPTRAEQREAQRKERALALRDDLERAEGELEAATKAAREAERVRARAEREVESLRKQLARLE
jgi:hypothetical protein